MTMRYEKSGVSQRRNHARPDNEAKIVLAPRNSRASFTELDIELQGARNDLCMKGGYGKQQKNF